MARTRRKKGSGTGEFDARRWAYLIFVIGAFLGIYVLSNAIEDIWAVIWSWSPTIARPHELTSQIAAVVISVLGALYALRKERWFNFTIEVVEEISQVTWPTRAETRAATIVVIIMTLICSTLLWSMDQMWSTVTNWLYGI
jgi:preprotein translocase subunit SecE